MKGRFTLPLVVVAVLAAVGSLKAAFILPLVRYNQRIQCGERFQRLRPLRGVHSLNHVNDGVHRNLWVILRPNKK